MPLLRPTHPRSFPENTVERRAVARFPVPLALAVSLALISVSHPAIAAEHDECLKGPSSEQDRAQLTALREVVESACPCSAFDGSNSSLDHDGYVACARIDLEDHLANDLLRTECRETAETIFDKSTCGRPDKIPCVERKKNDQVKCSIRAESRCTDSKNAERISCPDFNFCVDAADTNGNLLIDPQDSGVCAVVSRVLDIAIASPAAGTLTRANSVDVTGTVDSAASTVFVNRVPAVITTGTFVASGIPLREGSNTLTATAEDADGNVGTASVLILRDTTPPSVVIDSPVQGQIVTSSTVTVVGSVNDIVTGTVNAQNCQVVVSGRTGSLVASVSNRTFLVEGFPVVPGENTLTAVARDAAGNESRPFQVTIARRTVVGQQLQLVSGNNQMAEIGQALPSPIVVRAVGANGGPIANRALTFRVVRNNGNVRSATSPEPARQKVVPTDANGEASVEWILGTRVGVGNNRLEASGVGFPLPVLAGASAEAAACEQIFANSGENQVGITGSRLARPFEVVAVDGGGNLCVGVPVTFRVNQGGGSFGGASEITIETNADGRASALFTLGPEVGINSNSATASFPGLIGQAASFIASAQQPAGATRFRGIVLDTENEPIPNARVTIEETALETFTNDAGQFLLENAPAGAGLLFVDGSTTTRPEQFPQLEFQIDVVAGIDNSLGMPIFIPALDQDNFRQVGAEDVVLEMDGLESFSLKVFANSAFLPDGAPFTGFMGVTQVSNDQVPMPPNAGAAPPWVGTLQPAGIHLDPPAQLTVPNSLGLPEGQIVDLFSFDHDLQQFVGVGTGTVQPGGATIASDPGSGLIKSGWFFDCPPPPPPSCAAACGPCKRCENGRCVADSSQDGDACNAVPLSFSNNGVNIEMDSSCQGVCMSGACSMNANGYDPTTLKTEIEAAIGAVYSMCIDDVNGLRTAMQSDLQSKGVRFFCRTNIAGSPCANAPGWTPGNNDINLFQQATEPACGALRSTIIHEVVHAAFNYFPEDKPSGCEEACFPGGGFGNAADCQ